MKEIFSSIGYSTEKIDYSHPRTTGEGYIVIPVLLETIKITEDYYFVINIEKSGFEDLYYHAEELVITKKDNSGYYMFIPGLFIPFYLEKAITLEKGYDGLEFETDEKAIRYYTKIIKSKKELYNKAFEIITYEIDKISQIFDKDKINDYLNYNLDKEEEIPDDNISNHEVILTSNKCKKYDSRSYDIGKQRKIQFDFYEIKSRENGYFYFTDACYIVDSKSYNVYEYFPPAITYKLKLYQYKNFSYGYKTLVEDIDFFYIYKQTDELYNQKVFDEAHEFFDKFISDL